MTHTTDDNNTKPFKQVNIAASDWADYNQTALGLGFKRNERVSIPALLREAYIYYKENVIDSL